MPLFGFLLCSLAKLVSCGNIGRHSCQLWGHRGDLSSWWDFFGREQQNLWVIMQLYQNFYIQIMSFFYHIIFNQSKISFPLGKHCFKIYSYEICNIINFQNFAFAVTATVTIVTVKNWNKLKMNRLRCLMMEEERFSNLNLIMADIMKNWSFLLILFNSSV